MRTLEIHPPSVRTETLNVLRVAAGIVLIVAAYIFRPSLGTPSSNALRQPQAGLLPYQQLIRDAAPVEQRLFRELQEGLLEAERIRAQSGRWPDVTTLEAEGIPPFTPDPTRKIAYKWTSVRQDWATNYLGVPSDSSLPAWVLSSSSQSRAHCRIPRRTTKRIIVYRTARRAACVDLNIPEAKRRSGFAALRLPQNDGWDELAGRPNEQ